MTTFKSFLLLILLSLLSFNTHAALTDHFVTTWKTDNPGSSNDTSITIFTNSSYTYAYDVDWDNDGVFDNFLIATITDDNGNYVFDDLPAGAYVVEIVSASLPSGVTWTQTGDPDEFAQTATNPDHITTSPIILAPGDVYVNADFGYQGDVVSTHDIGSFVYLDSDANGMRDNNITNEPGIGNVTVTLIDSVGNTIAPVSYTHLTLPTNREV